MPKCSSPTTKPVAKKQCVRDPDPQRASERATFAELVGEVRDRDLRALANTEVTFDRLVEAVDPVRSTASNRRARQGLTTTPPSAASIQTL